MGSSDLQELPLLRKEAPVLQRVRFEDIIFPPWQRPIEEPRVKRISGKAFDINMIRRPLLGPAKVSGFNICDGQHTVKALMLKGFEWWDCDVAQLDEAGQILRFANQKDNVRAVSPLDQVHAMHLGYDLPRGAGIPEFQRAREIVEGIREAGWDYARGRRRGHVDCSKVMTVITTSGVEEVYDRAEALRKGNGKRQIVQTLTDLYETWPHDPNATEPGMIRAFGKIGRVYGPLTPAQKAKLGAVPTETVKLAAKGKGHQDDKRDILADYISKDILGLRAKGEFRKSRVK